jgi:N6-adenosine-specific RNA methylase IME4
VTAQLGLGEGGGGTRYACLSADPPWKEHGGGQIQRGADRHYGLLSKEQILDVMIGSGMWRPADHAHFHCWFTDNFLEDALWLVDRLGFRYVRTLVWVKTSGATDVDDLGGDDLRMGIGQYARGCHESWIFAVRGRGQDPSVWRGDRSVRSVVAAPHVIRDGKRVHSAKPVAAYETIERVSRGPRVEFFARSGRVAIDGERWDACGNEAPSAPEEP